MQFCAGKPSAIRALAARPGGARSFRRSAASLLAVGLAALFSAGFGGSIPRALAAPVRLPAATPLSIELLRHTPMKAGEPLQGRLLYPLYAGDRLAIPAGALVRGEVVRLRPDHHRRLRARLGGDFTPFHIPVVRFDRIQLPDSSWLSFAGGDVTDGAPVLHLTPPAPRKKSSLISRQIADQKQRLKSATDAVTGPGKGDRIRQFLYSQLPYHPERIQAGTTWLAELSSPLAVDVPTPSPDPAAAAVTKPSPPPSPATPSAPSAPKEGPVWKLRAYLVQSVSSASSKPGDPFLARISEPVFDGSHALVVPQNSMLVGVITQARPARSFGRQGKLRFHFRELRLPDGFSQPVQSTISGIDSSGENKLQLDSEGGVQPRSQNRVAIPLMLSLLATTALDGDGGSQVGQDTVASNGFGIVGRVVGIAAASRPMAASIGFYGAGLAVFDLWLGRGRNVSFVKNTRIEVNTIPTRRPLPSAARPQPH